MRRVAFISDVHFDEGSRFSDCSEICNWITSDLEHREVDAIAIGGDLYEGHPAPAETAFAAEWLVSLGNIAPVVGVYGNHDRPQSLDEFNLLRASHSISFYDRPTIHTGEAVLPPCEDLGIACLPWPRKGELLAALGRPVGREEGNQIAADLLRNVLRGLGDTLRQYRHRLFIGHVQLRGCRTSLDQPPLLGCDFELGAEDLALVGAQAYALGHIHLQQEERFGVAPVFYPGAPRRCNFGEASTKYYSIVTLDDQAATVEYIETPARPMVLLEADWYRPNDAVGAPGQFSSTQSASLIAQAEKGAEVRFRYRVDPDQRDAAKAQANAFAAELRDMGARSVKVEEEVIASGRARMPEIATAATLPDKLRAMWTRNGIEPDRQARLLDKLSMLEMES